SVVQQAQVAPAAVEVATGVGARLVDLAAATLGAMPAKGPRLLLEIECVCREHLAADSAIAAHAARNQWRHSPHPFDIQTEPRSRPPAGTIPRFFRHRPDGRLPAGARLAGVGVVSDLPPLGGAGGLKARRRGLARPTLGIGSLYDQRPSRAPLGRL